MSQWTHVAAVIRFDAIRFGAMFPEDGKVDPLPELAPGVPTGSEGPLTVLLWANPSVNSVAAYTATIFGDLRDFDSADAVLDYLRGLTAKWEGGIRAGLAEIFVEGQPVVLAVCDENGIWKAGEVREP